MCNRITYVILLNGALKNKVNVISCNQSSLALHKFIGKVEVTKFKFQLHLGTDRVGTSNWGHGMHAFMGLEFMHGLPLSVMIMPSLSVGTGAVRAACRQATVHVSRPRW